MSTLPVLALPISGQPAVFLAAQVLADRLDRGDAISRSILNAELAAHFGGSDAAGRWSVRDVHAALELAQVLWLQSRSDLDVRSTPGEAARHFDQLEALVPRQTVRSEEQIELQQFATPPRLAWLAARACAPARGELLLEPSAGTGMLAVWADKAGARLALNEISGLRCDCLTRLFPAASVSSHDGELIDELLARAIRPQAVLMNPPYSWSAERGRDGRTAARRGAVRLHGPRGGTLGLAEGIETALSAKELFSIPCWATLGTERFGLVAIPESVSELHLFIDHDAAGELAERKARAAYEREGRVIFTHRPEQPGADFNDVLMVRQQIEV